MTSLLLLLMLAAPGQQPATTAAPPPAPRGPALEYELGPGDLLSIRVTGVKEFDQSVRVSNSGRIRVPYVGIMFVAGMTALQVERDIAKLIMEHELINEPSVRVQVDEYRAQPTYVIGEVTNPGQFVITGEMYLLDLISKAGGLRDTADATGFLYRRNAPRPSVQARVFTGDARSIVGTGPAPERPAAAEDLKTDEVIQVNLKQLREGTRPEVNVRLQGGDILYIPRVQQESIYVIGDVKIPGAYTLPRRGEVSAAQAIIYAGGPLPTAKTGNGFIMRHDAAGVRQAIPVDFASIIEGKQPDVPVRPNDIVFVPNSGAKTVGIALFNMLPELVRQFLIF